MKQQKATKKVRHLIHPLFCWIGDPGSWIGKNPDLRPYLNISNATGSPCHELTSRDDSTPPSIEGETRRKKRSILLSSQNLSVR
jgi:hypothetical protein